MTSDCVCKISSDGERGVSTTIKFLKPEKFPPPKGITLILLTKGNKPTIGKWGDDCKQWLPLPMEDKS